MNDAQLHQLFLATLKDDPIRQDKPVNHTHTLGYQPNTSHTHSIGSPIWTLPNQDHMDQMRRRIEQGIYENNVILNQLTKQAQEKPMSTLDKIKAERREKREREELEAKFEEWEAVFDDCSEVGSFTVHFNSKAYRYATILAEGKWYLTGQTTCAMAQEEFIAWLIDKNVDPHDDFVWMKAVE